MEPDGDPQPKGNQGAEHQLDLNDDDDNDDDDHDDDDDGANDVDSEQGAEDEDAEADNEVEEDDQPNKNAENVVSDESLPHGEFEDGHQAEANANPEYDADLDGAEADHVEDIGPNDEEQEGDNVGPAPKEETGARGYGLRPARSRSYAHWYDHQFLQSTLCGLIKDTENSWRPAHQQLCGVMLNQMSAQAGIKKHGQDVIDALFKEFAQLHENNVFGALDPTKLSRTTKKAAL